MSLRNLITLLALFVVVSLGLWVAILNPDSVTFRLPGFPPREYSPPLWVVTFLSIVVGVFFALLYSVVLSSKDAFARWRSRRRERSAAENDELLRDGLEAAVEGDDATARKRFGEVLESDPEHQRAWRLAGDAARRMGDLDEAVELHGRARGIDPEDPAVHEALAADFEAMGQYARAVSHLEQSISYRSKPDAGTLAWLRDLLVRERRWDEALDAQKKRIRLLRDPVARVDEEALRRGLELERGRQLLERGGEERRAEAESIFASLLKEDESFVPAHLLLGEAKLAADEPDEAIQVWLDGIEVTHSLPLIDHLVDHYLDAGQPENALKVYQRAATELDGARRLAAGLGLALLYARLEMVEEAESVLQDLEARSEYSPVLRFYQGRLAQRRGEDAEAAETYREVIDSGDLLDPHYRCQHCGARYEELRLRCLDCGRWGTVDDDRIKKIRADEEERVHAPRV